MKFHRFGAFRKKLKNRRTEKLRKSVIYFIPLDYCTQHKKVVRCFIDDDVPDVRRHVLPLDTALEKQVFVK